MSDPKPGWLERSLASARAEVATWPEWKREAMRVLPDPVGAGGVTMDETMTDDRLRHLAAHWPAEMRAVTAELLAARDRERRDAEALRAADVLAERIAVLDAARVEIGRLQASASPSRSAIRCADKAFALASERLDAALAAYRATRGAR